MTRTIDPRKGRRRGRHGKESVDETLESARKVLADVSSFLETELLQLYEIDLDPEDPTRLNALKDLIKQDQQALLKVLEMRQRIDQKLGEEMCAGCPRMIDLEAARAEIDRRLDRLASE